MLSHNSHSGVCTCTGECLQNSTAACNVVTWSQYSLRQRCHVIHGVFWTSTVVNASLQAALDKRNICSRSHPRDLRMRFLFYSFVDCLSTCLLGFRAFKEVWWCFSRTRRSTVCAQSHSQTSTSGFTIILLHSLMREYFHIIHLALLVLSLVLGLVHDITYQPVLTNSPHLLIQVSARGLL